MRILPPVLISSVAFALFIITARVSAQTTRPVPVDLIDRLLELPAPKPEATAVLIGGIPGDEAPMERQIAFWSAQGMRDQPAGPSDIVRRRFLGWCVEHPADLRRFLPCLRTSQDAVDMVKVIYDTHEKEKIWSDEDRAAIRTWLRQRSRHFRNELIAAARSTAYRKIAGYNAFVVENEEDLIALAQLDWNTAKPILLQFADGKELHAAAFSLQILAQRAWVDHDQSLTGLLDRLRKIADDRNAPGYARDRAFSMLESVPWEGRDEWYLSLFAQFPPGEFQLKEGILYFAPPVWTLVAREPEHYVPLVAKLLDSKDKTARDNAAYALANIPRVDAMRPLLRVLNDAKNWPPEVEESLLRNLIKVDLPQCVPGILKAWPDLNGYLQIEAAEALVRQNAKEAPAKLRALLLINPRIVDLFLRPDAVNAMISLDVFTADEIAADVEALCADNVQEKKRRQAGDYTTDTQSQAVKFVRRAAGLITGRHDVAEKLLRRADALDAGDPAVAAMIRRQLTDWPVAVVDADLLKRATGKGLDEAIVTMAVARLPGIRNRQNETLRELARHGGSQAGLAAALLYDDAVIGSMLHGNDRAAKAMLLATARLAGEKIPIPDVVACFDVNNDAASRAAEWYLIDQDTAETRHIVSARHPGQVLIFGGAVFPAPPEPVGGYGPAIRTEEVRTEMQGKDAPDAIYALFSAGGWGSDGQRVIRVRDGRAVLSCGGANGRVQSRALSAEEFKSLLDMLTESKFDDLPDLDTGVQDGIWYHYVHLTRDAGRAIYINNPGVSLTAGTPYHLVTNLFRTFNATGMFSVKYKAQQSVPGLALLSLVDEHWITRVWKNGDDFRVRVSSEKSSQWHAFRDGRVAEQVDAPAALSILDSASQVPAGFDINTDHPSPYFIAAAGPDVILPGKESGVLKGGLWRCRAGKTPLRVTAEKHEFRHPVTSADGKWAVATEAVNGWNKPTALVHVRLSDGDVGAFDLPTDRYCEAVGRSCDGRIVTTGWKYVGRTEDRVYWLVDPATGKTETVTGDFAPLEYAQQPLQPTSQQDIFWAVGSGLSPARIGKYDLKHFQFTPLVVLQGMYVSNEEMWVDETENAAYLCVSGDLLRVPLGKETKN